MSLDPNKARQSGDLLERYREGRPRNWLTLDRIAVHDEAKVGILPMGVLLSRVGAARADNPPTAEGLADSDLMAIPSITDRAHRIS